MTTNILPGFDDEYNAVGVTPRKTDKRWRGQFRFWLDAHKPGEYSLGKYINSLKDERKFASTIRDAIRLIRDLRAGRVDVLLELFPFVRDAISPPQPTAGDEFAEIIAEQQAALLAKIDALAPPAIADEPRSEPLTPHDPPIIPPEHAANPGIAPSDTLTADLSDAPPAPRLTGPKPLAIPQFAAPDPTIDDDDTLLLAVCEDESAGKRAAQNFINSVQALV